MPRYTWVEKLSYPQFARLQDFLQGCRFFRHSCRIFCKVAGFSVIVAGFSARLQISGFKNAREAWLRGRCFFPKGILRELPNECLREVKINIESEALDK